MEDSDLKNIWKEYDRRLEEARVLNLQSWALNLQCFEMLQRQKMRSKLGRLAWFKVMVIVLGLPWIFLLGFIFVVSLRSPVTYISITLSAGIIFLFYVYAIIAYIRHLVQIRHINNSDNIVDTQWKLAWLQGDTLRTVRILFLQTPFYSTFMYSAAWIQGWDPLFWYISVPVTLLLTAVSVWLFRHLNERNTGRKWFRAMFKGPEWNYTVQSIGFIKEIDDFRQNI